MQYFIRELPTVNCQPWNRRLQLFNITQHYSALSLSLCSTDNILREKMRPMKSSHSLIRSLTRISLVLCDPFDGTEMSQRFWLCTERNKREPCHLGKMKIVKQRSLCMPPHLICNLAAFDIGKQESAPSRCKKHRSRPKHKQKVSRTFPSPKKRSEKPKTVLYRATTSPNQRKPLAIHGDARTMKILGQCSRPTRLWKAEILQCSLSTTTSCKWARTSGHLAPIRTARHHNRGGCKDCKSIHGGQLHVHSRRYCTLRICNRYLERAVQYIVDIQDQLLGFGPK